MPNRTLLFYGTNLNKCKDTRRCMEWKQCVLCVFFLKTLTVPISSRWTLLLSACLTLTARADCGENCALCARQLPLQLKDINSIVSLLLYCIFCIHTYRCISTHTRRKRDESTDLKVIWKWKIQIDKCY